MAALALAGPSYPWAISLWGRERWGVVHPGMLEGANGSSYVRGSQLMLLQHEMGSTIQRYSSLSSLVLRCSENS